MSEGNEEPKTLMACIKSSKSHLTKESVIYNPFHINTNNGEEH